jgi:2-dehydropantoate 2-reductase
LNTVPHVTESISPFEYIVCCTKNVPDAGPSLCEIIAPGITAGHTVIVLIQNGLNIERQFLSRFPENIILSGVSRNDAHEVTPGVIEQKQKDNLHIGPFDNARLHIDDQRRAAERFVRLYNAGEHTTCLYEPGVAHDRWSKLVYNATLNPICALTGVNTGDLHLTEGAFDALVIPAMKEVTQVSEAKGYPLPENIILETILSNPIDEKISPSMQMDLEKVREENLKSCVT